MTIEEITSIVESDKLIQKYLYPYHWISGSSTTVYPIAVWIESKEIVVQVEKGAWRLRKHLQKMVETNKEAFSDAYFSKSDGSCPDRITFYCK